MSMFRRPTDDDSTSDSDTDQSEETDVNDESRGSAEEFVRADLTRTETLSSGESISIGVDRDDPSITNVEHHRNMMLASLLEDFYRTRAAELLNTTHPGANYHRQSPEVQQLAASLFTQAGQTLAAGGVLPASVTSAGSQGIRNQYLAGFDSLGLQNITDSTVITDLARRRLSADTPESQALVRTKGPLSLPQSGLVEAAIQDMAVRVGGNGFITHPATDMRLTNLHSRSHYQSSFQEMRLLGKGGFGRVYHTYNLFDKKDYAVKKIPLSPRLSQRYRESGHAELTSILREVQALAQLDHCNVVRYHATWIEEPTAVVTAVQPAQPRFSRPQYMPRMLANKPANLTTDSQRTTDHDRHPSFEASNGVVFAPDSFDGDAAQNTGHGWLHEPQPHEIESSSAGGTSIFTDGLAKSMAQTRIVDDPYCYVLHVQMSLYPQTLAQYMSPPQVDTSNITTSPPRRHCFHLLPTLRILLGILSGLQYIHANGLVHRDIKPGNIFISHYEGVLPSILPEGYQDIGKCRSCLTQSPCYVNPRIGDFGLVTKLAQSPAEVHIHSGSSSDKAIGTEYYRPPLNNKGKGQSSSLASEKLDVFALGVIFVELLCQCGTSMERLEMLKDIQHGKLPSGLIASIEHEAYGHDVGTLVEQCILGMIQQHDGDRWDCGRVKDWIEAILMKCEHRPDEELSAGD